MWIDDDLLFSNFSDQALAGKPGDSKPLEARYELESGRRYGVRIETCWEGTLAWRELAIRCAPPEPENPIQAAVELAHQADVVIVVAGLNKEWESEGFDRQDMRLPGEQDELIRRVTEANPNTIVVLNGGSPVEMPWLEGAAAVLQAWYLGQESGHAMADVLFGRQSPGGRLPVTFPRRLQDNPAYLHYPGENGRHVYGEGIFVGYRYYQRKGIQPLFPFGYGLSYTQFAYRNLELSSNQLHPGENLHASVEVTNSGRRRGSEVVQWYLHQKDPILVRPERWLAGFSKVELDPGEARAVEFELDQERLAYYDDLSQSWEVQPGEYSLLVGSSCEEIHFQEDFELLADKGTRRPTPLRAEHWLETGRSAGRRIRQAGAAETPGRAGGPSADRNGGGSDARSDRGFCPGIIDKRSAGCDRRRPEPSISQAAAADKFANHGIGGHQAVIFNGEEFVDRKQRPFGARQRHPAAAGRPGNPAPSAGGP